MGKLLTLLCLSFLALVSGKKGFGPTDQEWGYVTVRKDAHMFWWLHYTTANVSDYTERPLIIWLQGGPGASSTGFGNFKEIGPLDVQLKERNSTWVKHANVLLVDNPVGTGYSYVENNAYARNNEQIAKDFLELMKSFYKDLPQFQNVSTYIFSESYGGKMAADIALLLYKENKAGKIKCQLKGVGLGDSWISPLDSVLTWAPYLRSIGAIDEKGEDAINKVTSAIVSAYQKGDFKKATSLFFGVEKEVSMQAYGVDFYNVLTRIASHKTKTGRGSVLKAKRDDEAAIAALMNGAVKEALNISRTWGDQSFDVFEAVSDDFMRPVIYVVEELLNSSDIQVAVYNGQLDLIVDTIGSIHIILDFNSVRSF
ncbi:unnamed protein product [Callosobruchus maculatus]|uniref:Carboxypeptidase n=1 Tax=Callosobruchus maculatus TaxID=64391 RepID=A0A653DJL7_CALMS|nr:unnamed protein product [Callosobruchus maculatus]